MIETFLSVVAPLEGEGGPVIEAFIVEVVAVLRELATHYEIVLVDDGTHDDSVARVRGLLGKYDFVRLLSLSRHFGEETAIAAGLEASIGDFVIVMLPNMDPPTLIPEFVAHARTDADIVYGVRQHRQAEPLWYRAGARMFYWLINDVLGAGLPRDSTQFRCMSRQVVNAITQIRDPDRYLRVLTSYVGFRKHGLPYAPINRNGRASIRPKGEAVGLARALIIDHTSVPLRAAAWLAVAISVVVLVVAVRQSAAGELGSGVRVQGAAEFLMVMIVLAIMAEYLSGILRRFRSRPAYYVSDEQSSAVLLREERKNVVHDSA